VPVKGRRQKVIDSACSYGPYGNSGSDFIMDADGYFAQPFTNDATTATGYWNGERNASHAHDNLGELQKNGNCWAELKARLRVQR
jgi:hypothetical protein